MVLKFHNKTTYSVYFKAEDLMYFAGTILFLVLWFWNVSYRDWKNIVHNCEVKRNWFNCKSKNKCCNSLLQLLQMVMAVDKNVVNLKQPVTEDTVWWGGSSELPVTTLSLCLSLSFVQQPQEIMCRVILLCQLAKLFFFLSPWLWFL